MSVTTPPPLFALWPPPRLAALAEAHETPTFVYDSAEIRRRIQRVRGAFGPEVGLLYAMKANPLPALLAAILTDVDGLDVASEGEVDAALAAGYDPGQLRLAGPGKSSKLLAAAVARGLPVSVESPEELEELRGLAAAAGRRTPVALRLQPRAPVRAFGVSMARPSHPFGLDTDEQRAALRLVTAHPDDLHLLGVHVYAGTQCRSGRAWLTHLAEVLDLAEAVHEVVGPLEEINVGGGFGVATDTRAELDVERLGPKARRMLAKFPGAPRFVLELGRFLVADAGVYLTRVRRIKTREGHRVAVLDGGVHHLWAATGQLGPAPRPVAVRNADVVSPEGATELIGPLCTPLDHLGRVPGALRVGDIVAFPQAGAYGATLSPVHFLGHGWPREVLI